MTLFLDAMKMMRTNRGGVVKSWFHFGLPIVCLVIFGCRGRVEDPSTVVMIIESSPNNLDLRQGTDAQSERVGGMIFDALVK